MSTVLRAPFPYFGGKSRIAAEVWRRFGNPDNYVEPFFGSGSVLLARPHAAHERGTETVNDADALLANFWRAVQADPAAVAASADWPVNEVDLHARHLWLLGQRERLAGRLLADAAAYDARSAGWWVWGICQWIGSGWCAGDGPWTAERFLAEAGGGAALPVEDGGEGDAGMGIHRKRPHLGDAGRGIHRKLPHLSDDGECAAWRAHLTAMMEALADRLRRVRVCCGDWTRVLGETPTTRLGTTAVFLDPPYALSERAEGLYAHDGDVSTAVREWAIARGGEPGLRIALCGYEGEHAMPAEWETVPWKAHGGYGSQGEGLGRKNAAREVVWFSPHCVRPAALRQLSLLDDFAALAPRA